MKKIYVICPYGLVTGGPDALHQLVYYLNNNGYKANIVYADIKSYRYDIPIEYKIYVNKYLLLKDIEDNENNILVVPEMENHILNNYKMIKKYIWWLSVDNDLKYSGIKNKIKKIFAKIRLKNLKKLYKLNTLKNVIKHSRYDFSKEDNIEHLCASYYAFDYVSNNIMDKNKVHLCIEPISKIFLDKSKFCGNDKSNIILYNPKKNLKFTKLIINKAPNMKFVPLTGFSQDELIKIYQKSKVYMDFGFFPGAERIPKEAVINGCCIITGKYGASNYYKDVPILDKYKIEAKEENIEKIILKIKDLIDNYDKNIEDFETYRNVVWNLEDNFIESIKKIF